MTLHLTGRHDGFPRHHVPCSRPASERSRSARKDILLTLLRLSDVPAVTLRLGDPALLRWEDAGGYTELEVGPITDDDDVVRNLEQFWAGRWRDWSYGFNNEQFVI